MRIITWNIRNGNSRAVEAATVALSYKPDILCLQEVSLRVLEFLRKYPGYSVHASYDFLNKDPNKTGYSVILSRFPVTEELEVPYDNQISRSLLDKILYRFIAKQIEQHNAIVIKIDSPNGALRIVNTRLSCAVSTRNRLAEFYKLITNVPNDLPIIYCGDLNIVDNKLFNRVTGWLRGFTRHDYRLDERKEFEVLFKHIKCVNIFKGISTGFSEYPMLQFDHILIPTTMRVLEKQTLKKKYGSDHKMLVADII